MFKCVLAGYTANYFGQIYGVVASYGDQLHVDRNESAVRVLLAFFLFEDTVQVVKIYTFEYSVPIPIKMRNVNYNLIVFWSVFSSFRTTENLTEGN